MFTILLFIFINSTKISGLEWFMFLTAIIDFILICFLEEHNQRKMKNEKRTTFK